MALNQKLVCAILMLPVQQRNVSIEKAKVQVEECLDVYNAIRQKLEGQDQQILSL